MPRNENLPKRSREELIAAARQRYKDFLGEDWEPTTSEDIKEIEEENPWGPIGPIRTRNSEFARKLRDAGADVELVED
jgi:hypothetical protein